MHLYSVYVTISYYMVNEKSHDKFNNVITFCV